VTPVQLEVTTPEGFSGVLFHETAPQSNRFIFQYDLRAPPDAAVSLTMPVRRDAYTRPDLLPVFQMNLPEGYLLEQLSSRLAKTSGVHPLVLLALLGGDASVGRLRFSSSDVKYGPDDVPGERLGDILAYRGAEGLFGSLVDRYLMRTALSGVQPKVLVPEAQDSATLQPAMKGTARTADFIVKSGLSEYPGLAINEFICMTAAAQAGIQVPEFYLSDDRSLFVMRRFDRDAQGAALGFEDMAVLAAKGAAAKYTGRYEDIVRTVRSFVSTEHLLAGLQQLFDTVALSCIVGNGDAHLKNFGLLYDGGVGRNVRMAPAFDIVCTTCYLPNDVLALALDGNKSIYAARLGLRSFGKSCGLTEREASRRVLALCDAVESTLRAHRELANGVERLADELARGIAQFRDAFRPTRA